MKAAFSIRALGYKPLLLTSDLPHDLMDYHIPGSTILSAVAPFGKFLLQKIELDGFTCTYSIFDIQEDVSFLVYSSKPLAICHINLLGNAEYDINQLGILVSKQSQFNILFCPYLHCSFLFKKGHRYISIDILYPLDFMVQSLAFYPSFEKFQKDIDLAKASSIPDKEVFLNAGMTDKVYQLIHSPVSPNVRNFHINLFRELLYGMLKEASSVYTQLNKFFIHNVENIYAAKEFIDSHLSRHFTISEISRKVGINEQKLKKGFKEVFGKGVFEYLLSERLIIARIQIEQTNKPIKEIAYYAGYKSASNFATAFKKMFGDSPLNFRNKFDRK